MPVPAAHAELDTPKPTLVRGRMIVCPNCEQERDPLNQRSLKRLDRIEKYRDELNVVFLCNRVTGGCGHAFSPTSPEFTKIIQAWLDGDLVAREKDISNDKQTKEVKVVER